MADKQPQAFILSLRRDAPTPGSAPPGGHGSPRESTLCEIKFVWDGENLNDLVGSIANAGCELAASIKRNWR